MKIYALGGLGADKRTFTYIKLVNNELVCLDWLDPLPKETLKSYASRVNELIPKGETIGLMGVSFGGMIMTEVSKLRNPKHTILVSSVEKSSELRWAFRLAGSLKLDTVVPYTFTVKSGRLLHYLFGVKLMRDKKLLEEIMEDMDPNFIRWSVRSILSWENTDSVKALRIHGEKDRVLPINKENVDHSFKNAGHFVIVNEAEGISEILDSLV